jgi:hypothetical protein
VGGRPSTARVAMWRRLWRWSGVARPCVSCGASRHALSPFVWSAAEVALQELLDPENILNPGVLLNTDPQVHIRNLKPMPPAGACCLAVCLCFCVSVHISSSLLTCADPLVDRCIECGFCESACPSRDLTYSLLSLRPCLCGKAAHRWRPA